MTDPAHYADTTIEFTGNLVTDLPDNTFQSFTAVEVIDLHGNDINNGRFLGMRVEYGWIIRWGGADTTIEFTGNLLTDLLDNTFQSFTVVEIVDLHGNGINNGKGRFY